MEILLAILFNLIITIFSIYLYTRYFKNINLPERTGWIRFPFWILFPIYHIIICMFDTVYPVLNIVVDSIIFFGILITNYKLKPSQYLYHFIFYYVPWILSGLAASFLITTIAGLDFESVTVESGILSCLMMCLLTPLVIYRENNRGASNTKYKKKIGKADRISHLGEPVKYILTPIGGIYLSLYLFLTSTDYLASFGFFLFILFIFIISYLAYDTYEKRVFLPGSEHIEPLQRIKTHLYDMHATEYETAYLEDKKRRHRLNQYLSDIKRDVEMGNFTDAESKVNVIIKENTLYRGDISKSGNITIDSIINHKYGLLEKYGIKIDCSILIPEVLPFDHADLNNILNILLNNAICTCCNLPENKRKFTLSVSLIKGKLHMKLMYYLPILDNKKLNSNQKHPFSFTGTKKSDGLSHIQGIVNKYQGSFDIHETDTICKIALMLPLPTTTSITTR